MTLHATLQVVSTRRDLVAPPHAQAGKPPQSVTILGANLSAAGHSMTNARPQHPYATNY